MKVLVTGANGFLGSHLVDLLTEAGGFDVRVLVRPTSDLRWIATRPIEKALGDATMAPEALVPVVDGCKVVFHLAGLTKALRYEEFRRVNAEATRGLAEACLRVRPVPRRFVFVSTAGVCGPSPTDAPLTEAKDPAPVEDYSRSKLEAERLLAGYRDRLSLAVLRPAAIFGPRDAEMLPAFRAVQMGFASRLGFGTSWFNLGHARDVARAALLAGTAEAAHGETFLVGGPNVSQAELGEAIARALGRRRLVPLVVPRPVVRLAALGSSLLARLTGRPRIFTYGNLPRLLARNWKLDLGKAERLLGYRPEIGLERGVAETVGWYREHGWL